MHECRIYKGHPDSGGKLIKTMSADQCRARFWKELTGKATHMRTCRECGIQFETRSAMPEYTCDDCKPSRPCEVCGRTIPATYTIRKVTCSEACNKERRRLNKIEDRLRKKAARKPKTY